ncbi:MAG: hypothetical protein LBP38_06870 [Desulfovibrio sp.]|jgi:hypothetical protein|nr:hypothetical protein [Desulfovibrio sp.]
MPAFSFISLFTRFATVAQRGHISRFACALVVSLLLVTASSADETPPAGETGTPPPPVTIMPEFDPNISVDSAIGDIRKFQGQWSNEGNLPGLFNPLMSEQHQFRTMDGKRTFIGNLLCRDEAPIVTVTAFPVGSLSTISELNINIAYDYNLDGAIDHALTLNNVAGACLNGAVLNCKPSGSWKGCEYGFFEFDSGELKISTTFPGGAPRPPHGLQECFCFNGSCGATALVNMQKILNYFAIAVVNEMRTKVPDVVVAKDAYDAGAMTLSYLGARQASCSGFADDAQVRGATGLFGMLDFPYQGEVAEQEADPDSVWSMVYKHATSSANSYTCTRQNKVSLNYEIINAQVYTKFGMGWDSDGSSTECYWFSENGGCGQSFSEPGSLGDCTSDIMARHLGTICNSLFVSSGYLLSITDVTNAQITSGSGNMVACYGSENDGSDVMAEMTCIGKKSVEVPTCMSISKLDWRRTTPVYNDPYFPDKYDGCWKIVPVEDGCKAFAEREDCRVKNILSDGVFTVRNGVSTGLAPQKSCKQFKGISNTFTICEPWWREEYTYECDDKIDWEKERQRTAAITQGVSLDPSGQWVTQGDLGFNEDGSTFTRDLDAGVLFQTKVDECIPGCLVETVIPKNQMILPEQGKIASDGSYHLAQSEYSYMPSGERSIPTVLACVNQNGAYVCPATEGQTVKYNCTCANTQEFSKAISALAAIELASLDFICSSGEDQGVCSSDELGGDFYRVVCYKNETMTECSPVLWSGVNLPAQTHLLAVDNQFRCMVDNAGADYDPDYTFGSIVPVKEWFDVKLPWARARIVDYLRDSGKLDELAASCGCSVAPVQNVCRPTGLNGQYRCVVDSTVYDTQKMCDSNCSGDVRLAASGGFCILADPSDPQSGTLFGLRYDLAESPKPDEEKVFGDVEIGAGLGLFFTGEMSGSDMTCDDVPVQGEVRVDTIQGTCPASENCVSVNVTVQCKEVGYEGSTGDFYCDNVHVYHGHLPNVGVAKNCITYCGPGTASNDYCSGNCYATLKGTRYKCNRTGTNYSDFVTCNANCRQSTCTLPDGRAPSGTVYKDYDNCEPQCKYQQMVCLENNKVIQSQSECIAYRQDCYAGCSDVDNGDGTARRECSSTCGTQTVGGAEKNICTGTCEDTSYNEGTRTETINGSCSAGGSCSTVSVARNCEVKWTGPCNSAGALLVRAFCDGSEIYMKCGVKVSDGQNACNSSCKPYTRYKCDRTGTVYNDSASCNSNCQQSTCTLPGGIAPHGQVYTNNTVCQAQCFRQELHCAQSNKLVQSAAECGVQQFECSIDQSEYSTQAACAQSCNFEPGGALQYGSCADEAEADAEEQIKFSLWLTPTTGSDFGLHAKLSYVEPGISDGTDSGSDTGGTGALPNETVIAQTAYENEHLLLNQCALRYVNNIIYFDEPGTMAHFEFDHMDQFIFRTAVAQGLLPAEEGKNVLPYIPPVYVGSKARILDQAYLNQAADANAETGLLPPLPEAAQELAKDSEAQVPKRPMFWGKEIGMAWQMDDTTRLGKYAVTAGNLLPRVYYYECPDTYKVLSDTNTCMGQDPFGGVAPTIAGNFCFQYFCDASAITEDNPTQISGCGMVNDGRWE